MTDALNNIISTKGRREPFQVDVDDSGILVRAINDDRTVLVMHNVGPDTAYGNITLETATPEEGFPLPIGGSIVDDGSIDAWYFSTSTGETADIRGWEVEKI